jgi:hypothetical protein
VINQLVVKSYLRGEPIMLYVKKLLKARFGVYLVEAVGWSAKYLQFNDLIIVLYPGSWLCIKYLLGYI